MEAAAVDGSCRADLRPDRLRRRSREDSLRVAATASTRTRRAATSSSSRSTTSPCATVGRWPWPRRYHAQLIDRADRGRCEANLLRHQLHRSDRGRATIALLREGDSSARGRVIACRRDPRSGTERRSAAGSRPCPMFAKAREARHASAARYNYQIAVWRLPYAMPTNGQTVPSFAALLAGRAR